MKGIFHLRPPQPRYIKTCDVSKVWSYLKSLVPNESLSLKQLTLKTAALLTILAGRRIHTLHMLSVIHMDKSLYMVIFQIIGQTKCFKSTKSNQRVVSIAYVKDRLLCPIKCIYAYLAQRSEIVPQDFSEFLITFGKPPHPGSKELLARWVKRVIGNSGNHTEIFKADSARVASNTAAHKLGMTLLEALKAGSGRMRVRSLHTTLEKLRTCMT